MSNDNDKGRLTKEILRGVPAGLGLTRDEQILKTQTQQLAEMRTLKEQFRGSPATTPYTHEPIQIAAPQIHIDIPNVANELKPQFDDLLESQKSLADSVKGMGFQGALALRESRVHSGLLTSLDEGAKTAYRQRNIALAMMAQSIVAHDESSRAVEDIGRGIRGDLQQGNHSLFQIDSGIQTGNRSLVAIDRGVGVVNRNLSSIDRGVHQGNRLLTGIGFQVGHLEESLLGSLGELGYEISGLSDQVAQSSMQMLDALGGFEDVFLWAHQENMASQRRILYAVQNPISMKATNIWTLGERARKIGDYDRAISLYQQSLGIDPTSPRTYFSVAMIALERGDAELAKGFLDSAIAYAGDEPELKALIMMYYAKIEKFDGNSEKALFIHEKAFETYKYNLEIWFELAVSYIEKGEMDKALYFVKNLLVAARRMNPGYVYKVIATPQFFPILDKIRNMLATL